MLFKIDSGDMKDVNLEIGKYYRVKYYKEPLNRASITTEDLMFFCKDTTPSFDGIGIRFIDITKDILVNDLMSPIGYVYNPDFWKIIRDTDILTIQNLPFPETVVLTINQQAYSGEHIFYFENTKEA